MRISGYNRIVTAVILALSVVLTPDLTEKIEIKSKNAFYENPESKFQSFEESFVAFLSQSISILEESITTIIKIMPHVSSNGARDFLFAIEPKKYSSLDINSSLLELWLVSTSKYVDQTVDQTLIFSSLINISYFSGAIGRQLPEEQRCFILSEINKEVGIPSFDEDSPYFDSMFQIVVKLRSWIMK
jgi:hypothetical protein